MPGTDTTLIERIRLFMKKRKGVTEQKMFGSTCFLINGNMCVGPWKGSLIVRLDKKLHEQTQSEPHVKPMDITGRVMKGWARIQPAGIESDDDLKSWIDRAVRFVRTLPAKEKTDDCD
ncbi:MAG: TfoX/Sxy family protein [Planctomycetaceae bacterium]|nr:TfoX/Sxy family protein [Planctomycetaceae bacterium]